jgi:hypothetical protein
MVAGFVLVFGALLVWLAATGRFTEIMSVIKNRASPSS